MPQRLSARWNSVVPRGRFPSWTRYTWGAAHPVACLPTCYPLAEDAEVTVEANPDDVTPAWLDAVAGTPVNRISMGVQTFDDAMLAMLHRRHDSQQAVRAVEACREAGLENISIDLIYGLPGQTLAMWESDVRRALALQVTHLSAYALTYEDGTPLARMRDNNKVAEADEELSLVLVALQEDEVRVGDVLPAHG